MQRHLDAERPSRLQVDDELEFGRLQDRQVCGLGALEDAADIGADLPEHIRKVWPATSAGRGSSLCGQLAAVQPATKGPVSPWANLNCSESRRGPADPLLAEEHIPRHRPRRFIGGRPRA